MSISLSDYAWAIADLTSVSRADLHIATLMFLENVKLGRAKYKGLDPDVVPDYAELKESIKDVSIDELNRQIRELFNSFAKNHSELVKNVSRGNREEFEIALDEALRDVISDNSSEEEFANYVAMVSGNKYETIEEAIENCNEKILKLLSDVTCDIVIPSGVNTILNLNGYTITNDKSHTITNSGNLIIIGTGTVDNVAHQKAALFNDVGGVCVLENGLFNRSKENGKSTNDSDGNSFYTIMNHGTMTINDDVVVAQGQDSAGRFSSLIDNGWDNGNQNNTTKTPSVLTINGGKMIGGLAAVENDDFGVLTINGGEIINSAQNSVLNWNEATINGGTLTCDKVAIHNDYGDAESAKGILVINGGKINGGISDINDAATAKGGSVTLTGGIYSKDVSDLVSPGYKVVPYSGKFKVVVDKDYKPEVEESTTPEVTSNGGVES